MYIEYYGIHFQVFNIKADTNMGSRLIFHKVSYVIFSTLINAWILRTEVKNICHSTLFYTRDITLATMDVDPHSPKF